MEFQPEFAWLSFLDDSFPDRNVHAIVFSSTVQLDNMYVKYRGLVLCFWKQYFATGAKCVA